jgi:hypothetical protein
MSNHLPGKTSRRPYLPFIALLLAFLLSAATAQTASQPAEPPKPAPGIGATVQDHPPTPPASAEPPKPITKAQAKALFRSVDEILQFVSHDTGLAIKHKVKRKLITREQVERYVAKNLADDKDAQRLERSQLVLEKFGMIPHGYDLHGEYLELLREQVAAYYDPKTKTVNLLDWVQPELQRPVLAHELTHALQDQAVGLTRWLQAGGNDSGPLPDQQEQVVEEAQAARQNVSEGQAMLAMLDYTLAPAGLDVLKAPDTVDAMRASMTNGEDLPVLAAAPIYLRESLYMPYTFGLDFAREVLTKNGTQAAYAGVLEHPPADTLQIMRPETYLDHRSVPPLTIPDLDKVISPAYERYDFGAMGAFDVYLLARQYAPHDDPRQYYSHWRGGYYLAVHAKTAPKDKIGLIYVSRWDSPEAAQAFAKMYGDYVPNRYHVKEGVPAMSVGNLGGTVEWDAGEQGKIAVDIFHDHVLILEGLDEVTMKRLREALRREVVQAQ